MTFKVMDIQKLQYEGVDQIKFKNLRPNPATNEFVKY